MTDRQLAYARAELTEKPNKDGPLEFTASSEILNRHGFRLRHDGWRVDNFAANPVVLWMHASWIPPIGKAAMRKDPDAKRLMATVTFDIEGDELAATVDGKFRRGYLHAVSVGLDFVDEDGAPLNWWAMKPGEIEEKAFYDLAELSAVTVPADPTAVREQQRLGLLKIGRELVELFDEQHHPRSPITRDELDAAVRAELARRGIPEPRPDAGSITESAAAAVLAAFPLIPAFTAGPH